MTTSEYISLGVVIFNILLGLIAFFGGLVIRGLSDAIKEFRDSHAELQKDLGGYVKKDDYRADVTDLKQMIGRIFDRLDDLAKK